MLIPQVEWLRKYWEEKNWSCGSMYCICSTKCVLCMLHGSIIKPIGKPGHVEASVLRKVIGTLRAIIMKLVW